MKLTDNQEKFIESKLLGIEFTDVGEVHEDIYDAMLDEEIIDLSDDESGDLSEVYSNLVWDFIETKL
ncbi:MAG: hypothetical protein NT109_05525 [Flavobacteriia bacterium]|nr:hypothetical protein [Flavobacteriia bacterium]